MSADGASANDEVGDYLVKRWQQHQHAVSVESVPIESVRRADSPRLDGESKAHIELLAGSVTRLPPILVHRPTMRVIDGMHRLRAAHKRNQTSVDVQFFDGTEEEAFVLSVFANVNHGMPLSLKDRRAAAARILQAQPLWSDRLVASTTGLSHVTVAAVRRQTTGKNDQLHSRLGKDGKIHPLTNIEGRQVAAQLIEADSSASLREVARQAGISAGTVRDVRARLQEGADPVPALQRREPGGRPFKSGRAESTPARLSAGSALERLRVDPALKFTQNGRQLMRLLSVTLANADVCKTIACGAPAHCKPAIASVASAIGDAWHALAHSLKAADRGDLRGVSSLDTVPNEGCG